MNHDGFTMAALVSQQHWDARAAELKLHLQQSHEIDGPRGSEMHGISGVR